MDYTAERRNISGDGGAKSKVNVNDENFKGQMSKEESWREKRRCNGSRGGGLSGVGVMRC